MKIPKELDSLVIETEDFRIVPMDAKFFSSDFAKNALKGMEMRCGWETKK